MHGKAEILPAKKNVCMAGLSTCTRKKMYAGPGGPEAREKKSMHVLECLRHAKKKVCTASGVRGAHKSKTTKC